MLTPVQRVEQYWLKRDDLFSVAGVAGGKARTCWALSRGSDGLVTAGSRKSPQAAIVAAIAHQLRIPCHVHTPTGELGSELSYAQNKGAVVIQHKAGYNNVIIARAREDAAYLGWSYIPFGMECWEAVRQTSNQVLNIPPEACRVVIPVGSGMSAAGVVMGLREHGPDIPILGVCVGADPGKRLNTYCPGWKRRMKLVRSEHDYHKPIKARIGDVSLDPIYEAKCLPYLRGGDLLWIVGIRPSF